MNDCETDPANDPDFCRFFNRTNQAIGELAKDWIKNRHILLFNVDLNLADMSKEHADFFLHHLVDSISRELFMALAPAQSVIFSLLYAIVIACGLLGNSAIIYVFCRVKKLRTFRNMFIINLAIR
jgi:hypothetical protein